MNILRSLLLLSLYWTGSVHAADYYVSPDGNDGNPGSMTQPLTTLQAVVAKLQPGDVCYVRGGTYREPVELDSLKGTAERPILFRAYGEEPVVLDGTWEIDALWTVWKDGMYRAALDRPVWQLFDGDRLIDPARWPDASLSDASVWDVHAAMRSTDRNWDNKKGTSDSITQDGIIYDQNHDDPHEGVNTRTLAETGVDFTGALAVLNIGHWLTWTRPIQSHEEGSNQFTYDPKGTRMMKFLEYYILGLQALDRENEWWFDSASKTVYFKPETGKDPSELRLHGKVRDFNVTARNSEHVHFSGFTFFATTFGFDECRGMKVENCRFLYPSTHKFMLGALDWFGTRPNNRNGNATTYIYNAGEGSFDNIIRNCVFSYPNSPAINLNSPGALLENCYLHDIEWDVNSGGGSGTLPGGAGVTVRNCTLHTTGGSEGIRLGPGSTIEGVHIYNTSLLQHDGSAINIGTPSQPGTVARRNWVHDTNRQAMRFDSTGSSFGTDACVMENVFFKVEKNHMGGNKFKGDYQLVANNTAFDCFVAIPKGFGDTDPHNEHSLVRNNLADWLVEWHYKHRVDGITARMDHNVKGVGSVRRLLRDPDNFDFRPRAGAAELIDSGIPVLRKELPGKRIRLPASAYVGAAPDIGAYEFGDSRYWIPGYRAAAASTPVPPNGARAVKTDADLMWLEGYQATAHRVFFGRNEAAVAAAGGKKRFGFLAWFQDRGVTKISVAKGNIHDPGPLEPGGRYFWRVDAVRPDGGVQKGVVWTFLAGEPSVKE